MGLKDLISKTNSDTDQQEIDPIAIFALCNRQQHYAYLRANQKEFLEQWNQRRSERDIVGILNTGAGKTLIGLLMLTSKMKETGLPSLYLCPTVQLVSQVKKQAECYGISVCTIEDDWQNDFLNADKILVTTFHKLFSGKSIFGVRGYSTSFSEIGSIVIDDAHACIKYARQQSTIIIEKNEYYFQELFELFKDDIRYQSEGKFNSILRGEPSVCIELPYWTWIDNLDDIKNILSSMSNSEDEHVFQYRIIADYLDTCRCYISGNKIEITPRNIPISQIPSFFNAKNRYILSATLNNEDLCSELKIEKKAIINPIITAKSMTDVGERLIINPTKYHRELTDEFMRSFILEFSKRNKLNTIVIVPNSFYAEKWEQNGACILNRETIIKELDSLRAKSGEVFVLVNRYDGIDIPEDLSHILVLDGLPIFSTNREKIIQSDTTNYNWYASQASQKIEQGLGRTVRSVTDYSVVFLLGEGLSNFVGRNEYLKYFSPAVRKQLEISKELVAGNYQSGEDAIREINESIQLCLARDKQWMDFSKEELSKADPLTVDSENIDGLYKELQIFDSIDSKKFSEAESLLKELQKLDLSDTQRAKYYQLLAEIKYHSDVEMSNNLQIKSYESGNWENALKPRFIEMQRQIKGNLDQIRSCYKFLKGFSSLPDFSEYVDNILNNLVYDNHKDSDIFEESIQQLGILLGYTSKRPEKLWNDGGPDNLWATGQTVIIIECKNRRSQNRIVKDDIGQTRLAFHWFENTDHGIYQDCYNVIMHRSSRVAHDAPIIEAFSISEEKLSLLKKDVKDFKDRIINIGIENLTLNNLDSTLRQHNLEVSKFVSRYFVALTK